MKTLDLDHIFDPDRLASSTDGAVSGTLVATRGTVSTPRVGDTGDWLKIAEHFDHNARQNDHVDPETAAVWRRGAARLRCIATGIGIMPDDLPGDWRVEWEERAAIREYDGGQAREHAEAEALGEIIDRMRTAGEYPKILDI